MKFKLNIPVALATTLVTAVASNVANNFADKLNVRDALKLWEKFRKIPGGPALYSRLLGQLIPYTGTINFVIDELKPGYAKIRMNDRRAIRNHLGSIHAAALMNFAEAASGLALNYQLPSNGRAILTGFKIQYLKKARGTLTAISEVKLGPITEAYEEILQSTVTDSDGDIVASAQAIWKVGTDLKKAGAS